MTSQNPRDPRSPERNDSSTEKLDDLQRLEVVDASQVKGGDTLNPQPLPPGIMLNPQPLPPRKIPVTV